ncbi:hypothetical protein Sked_01230 [Sanguibacter keddieii DSM 10542]|uniref:Barstar (barnase inhibitor) domain-containing protein n=1 Tax=Sanguibacter keddieii (strain ATCC 51767 / DSM 10542 / NCFB 3025 / ST-74) TaxID=446469 RepID=D1BIQ3_SANKS|nr:barstar family protein [Sanguibacter keddieii]ACZ20095.1 hypothetical protein Sked_01230 [Sanguibacter keddieii DSM 10542]
MTTIDDLREVDLSQKFLSYDTTNRRIDDLAARLGRRGMVPRVLRGGEMRTEPDLFRETAAALQFPLYFGKNRDAFHDVIQDLDLGPVRDGIVIIVSEPDKVLCDSERKVLRWFIEEMRDACVVWNSPVEEGQWWDRPPVPFHVVIAAPTGVLDSVEQLWATLGAEFERLQPDPEPDRQQLDG